MASLTVYGTAGKLTLTSKSDSDYDKQKCEQKMVRFDHVNLSTEPDLHYLTTKLYTIITVDPDAPDCKNPIYKYYLHWLKINVNSSNPQTLVKYMHPDPPIGVHRYYFLICEHTEPIKVTNILTRSNFDLKQFCIEHKLTIDYYFRFTTGQH
jgi:phosphatidylethanolamine-binding protein (PEBP) family uncharacterized protein